MSEWRLIEYEDAPLRKSLVLGMDTDAGLILRVCIYEGDGRTPFDSGTWKRTDLPGGFMAGWQTDGADTTLIALFGLLCYGIKQISIL